MEGTIERYEAYVKQNISASNNSIEHDNKVCKFSTISLCFEFLFAECVLNLIKY